MDVKKVISNHKILSFVIASIFLQLSVLAVGTVLKANLPTASASLDKEPEVVTGASLPSGYAPETNTENKKLALNKSDKETKEASEEGEIKIKVKSGQTLTQIWKSNGGTYAGGIAAAKALEEAGVPLGSIRAGDEIKLEKDPLAGDIIAFHKKLRNGDLLTLRGNSKDGYISDKYTPKISEIERTASGTILHSFSEAAGREKVPYVVVDEMVDLFSTKIEFHRNLQPGDSFTITYIERRDEDNQLMAPGPIESASLMSGGKMLVAISHVGKDERRHYYDEKGNPVGNYFLRYPLRFSRISSTFSHRRFHPVLKKYRPHYGVDFAAPYGTPVRAVADGVVSYTGRKRGEGNMIKIKHSGRYTSAYLHLARIPKEMKVGVRVTRGQTIGRVGSTGFSTGPHLDYRLYDRGRNVNPLTVELPQMPSKFEPIPVQTLQNTLEFIKKQHEILRVAALEMEQAA